MPDVEFLILNNQRVFYVFLRHKVVTLGSLEIAHYVLDIVEELYAATPTLLAGFNDPKVLGAI